MCSYLFIFCPSEEQEVQIKHACAHTQKRKKKEAKLHQLKRTDLLIYIMIFKKKSKTSNMRKNDEMGGMSKDCKLRGCGLK